jgi:hypothetical protein
LGLIYLKNSILEKLTLEGVYTFNEAQYGFLTLNFPSCVKDYKEFPPTKFPEGFDPEAHGMIDISKW